MASTGSLRMYMGGCAFASMDVFAPCNSGACVFNDSVGLVSFNNLADLADFNALNSVTGGCFTSKWDPSGGIYCGTGDNIIALNISGGKPDINKDFNMKMPCSSSAPQVMSAVENNFPKFGNYKVGPFSVTFSPPAAMSVGSTIPISIGYLGMTQNMAVNIQSMSSHRQVSHSPHLRRAQGQSISTSVYQELLTAQRMRLSTMLAVLCLKTLSGDTFCPK